LFSGIVVVISVISNKRFDEGVDFVGGRTFQVSFENQLKQKL
jgi:SecD/SecF fusion protein